MKVRCPVCNGAGFIFVWGSPPLETCSGCSGQGEVEAPRPPERMIEIGIAGHLRHLIYQLDRHRDIEPLPSE